MLSTLYPEQRKRDQLRMEASSERMNDESDRRPQEPVSIYKGHVIVLAVSVARFSGTTEFLSVSVTSLVPDDRAADSFFGSVSSTSRRLRLSHTLRESKGRVTLLPFLDISTDLLRMSGRHSNCPVLVSSAELSWRLL